MESQTHEKALPERFLRSAQGTEQKAMGKSMTAETLVAEYEVEEVVNDPRDFIDPVKILDKLPKNFYDDLVRRFHSISSSRSPLT